MKNSLIAMTGMLMIVVAGVIVNAHVTVGPTESRLGASERYTVRVPTEGQTATVGVDLEVPEGVTVSYVLASSGWTSELKRVEKRVVGISWKVEIPPSHFGELVFNARNPKEGAAIAWKIKQRFADGTSSDWTSNTKLVAATAPTVVADR
jgi:uncharacterized protein YcnI